MKEDKELKWFMNEFDSLDEASKAQLVEQLRMELSRAVSDHHYCSLTQAPVVIPCSVSTCDFHVKGAKLNCGLCNRGANPDRPYVDVAKTLNCSEDEAREHILSTLRKLRVASLRDCLAQKKLNKYSMVPSRVCVNCGAICQNDQLKAGPFRYCSKVCYRERPPALVRIEYSFKTDVRTVLQISLQLFKSLKLISNVLQISRAHLLKIYEQYLNIRPHEFGTDVLDLIDLLRRSAPAPSIDSFIILDPAKARKFPKWLEHEEACRLLAARL